MSLLRSRLVVQLEQKDPALEELPPSPVPSGWWLWCGSQDHTPKTTRQTNCTIKPVYTLDFNPHSAEELPKWAKMQEKITYQTATTHSASILGIQISDISWPPTALSRPWCRGPTCHWQPWLCASLPSSLAPHGGSRSWSCSPCQSKTVVGFQMFSAHVVNLRGCLMSILFATRMMTNYPMDFFKSCLSLMSSAYSCSALMSPVKVAATSVKLAIPPPIIRNFPSGCLYFIINESKVLA